MKKTIVCCDITGKEIACREIVIKIGQEEESFLDAAGDTDYRFIEHRRTLDLSHEGAILLLVNLFANLKDGNTSVANNKLQKALDKAISEAKRCQN